MDPCGTCVFWQHDSNGWGECRRNAPVIGKIPVDVSITNLPLDSSWFRARWPLTGNGDGCGQHEPLPVALPPSPAEIVTPRPVRAGG